MINKTDAEKVAEALIEAWKRIKARGFEHHEFLGYATARDEIVKMMILSNPRFDSHRWWRYFISLQEEENRKNEALKAAKQS